MTDLQVITTMWRCAAEPEDPNPGAGLEWTAFFLSNRARNFQPPGERGAVYINGTLQNTTRAIHEHGPLTTPNVDMSLRKQDPRRKFRVKLNEVKFENSKRKRRMSWTSRIRKEDGGKSGVYERTPRVKREGPSKNGEHWKNQPDVVCPTCGTSGHPMVMRRWHFENCKGARPPRPTGELRTCPHCGFTGKGGGLTRWHFDNCPERVQDEHRPN